jgi:Na+-driven multidrug efflux pump
MSNARIYFYLTALSYPFIAIFDVAAALFRGMGNSKTAMINAFIMNSLNLFRHGKNDNRRETSSVV